MNEQDELTIRIYKVYFALLFYYFPHLPLSPSPKSTYDMVTYWEIYLN